MVRRHSSIFYSAITGNILEYYDFTVYSVFSAAIGKAFFPLSSDLTQILASLTIFAVGFVTRPVGGIVFGYIGDRWGRKASLLVSMFGITFSTFLMGLIPDYNYLGIYAPILLAILRLVQGLCISGEGTGTAIFILEHYKLRPGLISGIVHGSNIAGTLLASLVGILINRYCSPDLQAWRAAFVLGGLMGLIGCYLRSNTQETPVFQQLLNSKQILKAPFIHVMRTAWGRMIVTACAAGAASSIVYIIKAYLNIFYTGVLKLDSVIALYYVSYTSIILMLSMPVFGMFIDKFGTSQMMRGSTLVMIALSLPIMLMITSVNLYIQLTGLALIALIAGAVSTSAYIFVISLFPPAERFSGVGFSYNLGIAIFGGTSPAIARLLVESAGLVYAPAFYLMFTASLLYAALHYLRQHITLKL